MKTILSLLLISFLTILSGCTGKGHYEWFVRIVPTTDREREDVAELEVEILYAAIPSGSLTLSGHDQDWDDTIKMAHNCALETICKPTLWERYIQCGEFDQRESAWTGNWKDIEKNK